jgi:hypothetical protein
VAGLFLASGRSSEDRPPGFAGEDYLALVLELVAEETRTRDYIERRAAGVLAAVAVVVTVAGGQIGPLLSLQFAAWSGFFGALSAALLLYAGLFALLAIIPQRYEVASIASLERIVGSPEFWQADRYVGSRRSAEVHVETLKSTRAANGHKAWRLSVAFMLGLGAAASLVATIVALIRGA